MNMNDFQNIAVSGIRTETLHQTIEQGLMFLDDHLEEAATMYAKLEKAKGTESREVADKLADMLGFMLVDIAMICQGLMMNMGSIAKRNLMNAMQQRGETDLEEESAKGVLRKVYEMVGKVVQTGE